MIKLVVNVMCAAVIATGASAQDASKGEKIFKKCKACHKIGADAKNGVGPFLTGVVGRPAGSADGYKYSKTLLGANAAGLVWDTDAIVAYLENPKKYMIALLDDPKARPKMTLKLKKEQERRDVAAYLATFSTVSDGESDQSSLATLAPVVNAAMGTVCVVNAAEDALFFAVEVGDGPRNVASLEPGGSLCSVEASTATTGTVSVYEDAEAFEGCSRVIPIGTVEEMRKFAEFDRCAWSSNS